MATFGYDFITAAAWLKERVIPPDTFNVSNFIERNRRPT
jgi:hypothetical protein